MKLSEKYVGKSIKVLFSYEKIIYTFRGIYVNKLLIDNEPRLGNFIVHVSNKLENKSVYYTDLDNGTILGLKITRLEKEDSDLIRDYLKETKRNLRKTVKIKKSDAHEYLSKTISNYPINADWQYSATGGKTCEGKDFFKKECKSWFDRGLTGIQLNHWVKLNNDIVKDASIKATPTKNGYYTIKIEW